MASATAPFTVIASTVSQSDIAPNVGINTGVSLNYPQYVPVSVPSQIPSKTARIVNINVPQQVLPASSFNIIVTFQTFITTSANYIVHLSIPQLQLEHDSDKVSLGNLARGTALFTVTLPGGGGERFGLITGTVSLKDDGNSVFDSSPISINVLGGAEIVPFDHHIDTVVAPIPTTTGFDAIILASSDNNSLQVESHGFDPGEDVDLDIDIPMLNKHFHVTKKADINGIIQHILSLIKKDLSKIFPTIIHTKGHHSNKEGHKNINL